MGHPAVRAARIGQSMLVTTTSSRDTARIGRKSRRNLVAERRGGRGPVTSETRRSSRRRGWSTVGGPRTRSRFAELALAGTQARPRIYEGVRVSRTSARRRQFPGAPSFLRPETRGQDGFISARKSSPALRPTTPRQRSPRPMRCGPRCWTGRENLRWLRSRDAGRGIPAIRASNRAGININHFTLIFRALGHNAKVIARSIVRAYEDRCAPRPALSNRHTRRFASFFVSRCGPGAIRQESSTDHPIFGAGRTKRRPRLARQKRPSRNAELA